MAELSEFKLRPGDVAPAFALPGTDGRVHRIEAFAKDPLLVVVWWCNHCPYVRAWEGRMVELGRKYGPRGVGIALINANDAVAYPDDRMEMMVRRAQEHGYPFPYLRDESQEVARAYGALVTPHAMLFDRERRLLFQGRIDDDYEHPEAVHRRYLEEAIDAALAGKPVASAELPVLGCSVKWRA